MLFFPLYRDRQRNEVGVAALELDLQPLGGAVDLGLIAEDVAKVEPLLTSMNSRGEIEGVKYDRIGVALINAVQEQQKQIVELSTQVATQKAENRELRAQFAELKRLLCVSNAQAEVCKETTP